MKTIADLNALIPTLVELLRSNPHEIGEAYFEQDEDGWVQCENSASNHLCYEEDGWLIEIHYDCSGEWDNDSGDYWHPASCTLIRAWGEVTEISVSHIDKETDEESEFSDADVATLWNALDEELKEI